MKNKTKKIVMGALMGAMLVGGTTYGIIDYNSKTEMKEEYNASLGTEIEENGVQVKLLARTTADGYITDTYSFVITPENATNQNVTAVASYVDGTTYDNAVEVTVDNAAKTIQLKVSETAGFDKQIKVVVASESNPDVTAQMTLDFTKRFLNATLSSSGFKIGYGQTANSRNDILDNFEMEYSKYTIDEAYTIEWYGDFTAGTLAGAANNAGENVKSIAKNLVIAVVEEEIEVSADYIWNFSSSNEWHSFLKTTTSASKLQLRSSKFGYVVKNSKGETIKSVTDFTVAPELYIGYDYSSAEFKVDVDSITLENSSVIF